MRSGLAFNTATTCATANVGATDYSLQWNAALVKGFHLAPTGDHDAHCDNFGLGLTDLQGLEALRQHQERQGAPPDLEILGRPAIHGDAHAPTARQHDTFPPSRESEQDLEDAHPCADLCRVWNHEDVEEPIDGRGGRRQVEKTAIRLHVRDGDEGRFLGNQNSVHLHPDGGKRTGEDEALGREVIGEMAEHPGPGLGPPSLHGALDLLQQSVAPVREKDPLARVDPDVDPSDLAALEVLDDPTGLVAEAERPREHVAEPGGDGKEGNGQSHGGCRGGHQVRVIGLAGGRPLQETLEIREGLNASGISPADEGLLETSRRGPRSSIPGSRRHDDLNHVRHTVTSTLAGWACQKRAADVPIVNGAKVAKVWGFPRPEWPRTVILSGGVMKLRGSIAPEVRSLTTGARPPIVPPWPAQAKSSCKV